MSRTLILRIDFERDLARVAATRLNLFLPGSLSFRSPNALSLTNYLHENLITQNKPLHAEYAEEIARYFLRKYEDWQKDFEQAWEFLSNTYSA